MAMKGKEAVTASPDAKRSAPRAVKPFRFGFLIHDVSRMRRTLFDSQVKPLGITRSQWSVLAALSRMGREGMMQVDLARQMDVGKVTIGGLIERLERVGLVSRTVDAEDRRARRVLITQKGYGLINQMEEIGNANNEKLLKDVTEEELRITTETLAKVKANIREELKRRGED